MKNLWRDKPENLTLAEYAMQVAVRQSYAEIPDVEWDSFTTMVDGYPADEDPCAGIIADTIRENEAARADFVQERVAELLAMWAEAAA